MLGLSQPDVSRLLRGSFREYSIERFLRLLTALGRDVEIVIREPRSERQGKTQCRSINDPGLSAVPISYGMSKPMKTPCVPTPDSKEVFGQVEKRSAAGSTLEFQPTIRKPCPCSSLQCGTMQRGGVGALPSRFKTWGLGPRHAPSGRSSSRRPDGGRPISSWSGDWIAVGGS